MYRVFSSLYPPTSVKPEKNTEFNNRPEKNTSIHYCSITELTASEASAADAATSVSDATLRPEDATQRDDDDADDADSEDNEDGSVWLENFALRCATSYFLRITISRIKHH